MAENTPSANSHFRFFHNAETRLYIETAKGQKESIFSSIYTAFFSELNEKLADMKKMVITHETISIIFLHLSVIEVPEKLRVCFLLQRCLRKTPIML